VGIVGSFYFSYNYKKSFFADEEKFVIINFDNKQKQTFQGACPLSYLLPGVVHFENNFKGAAQGRSYLFQFLLGKIIPTQFV